MFPAVSMPVLRLRRLGLFCSSGKENPQAAPSLNQSITLKPPQRFCSVQWLSTCLFSSHLYGYTNDSGFAQSHTHLLFLIVMRSISPLPSISHPKQLKGNCEDFLALDNTPPFLEYAFYFNRFCSHRKSPISHIATEQLYP